MVSEFQCPCHGTMRIEGWTSRRLFKAGSNRDGWWTFSNMVEQIEEDAIKLFDALHPGCTAVFLFDNSSNHGAYPNDALVASRMPLNEQEWPFNDKKFQFKDTVVELDDGTTLHQSFYYDKEFSTRDRKGNPKKTTKRYFKDS